MWPYMVTSKNMKCITIILSKCTQGIYNEKYRTLTRESKNDINKCWDRPCTWIKSENRIL